MGVGFWLTIMRQKTTKKLSCLIVLAALHLLILLYNDSVRSELIKVCDCVYGLAHRTRIPDCTL